MRSLVTWGSRGSPAPPQITGKRRAVMSKLASILSVVLALSGASIAAAQEGGASISGTVKLDGAAKKPKKLNGQLDGDKFCGPQRAGKDVFAEDTVVGAENALANVLVHIRVVPGTFAAPKEPAEIDQNKCVYHPHIVVVQIGQTLNIKSSDDTMHNIHGLPNLNKEFNESQAKAGSVSARTFTVPEIGIKIKCDVHPWMGAWMHVVENPFHAVTGTDGKFKIDKLPAGTYEVEAWHEKFANGKETKVVKMSVT